MAVDDWGNPERTVSIFLKVIDMEQPPLRIFFGKTALPSTERHYKEKLENWRHWQELSIQTHG